MAINDIAGIIGFSSLTGAFFICVLLVLISVMLHIRKQADFEKLLKILVHLQTALLTLSFFSLAFLLQNNAFEFEQVFNSIENGMTWVEKIGGLWSGQASSLLFWSLVMSAAVSLSIPLSKSISDQRYLKSVVLTLEITLLFFIIPDVFIANPFTKIWMMPTGEISTAVFPPNGAALLLAADGQGMNPQLRHIAMMLHPPTLYLGLIGFYLPYAFALAGLVNRDEKHAWVKPLFPIALISWMFLTIGMILGSWWAYTILGWGGYWGWDAVEISGLLPWLLSFGLVHSMRLYIKGKHFRRWVYGFSFGIVNLIMLGILITRSGILESVHAYASGTMGPVLTILVSGHLAVVLFFSTTRKNLFVQDSRGQEMPVQEELFRLFNICLVLLAAIYLFGQTLPLTSKLVTGRTFSFTQAHYEKISAPLLFFVCVITALCPHARLWEKSRKRFFIKVFGLGAIAVLFPIIIGNNNPLNIIQRLGFWAAAFLLISWADALIVDFYFILSKKFNKRGNNRTGMLLIHLGLAVMAVGIMGVETLTASFDVAIAPQETISISDFSLAHSGRSSQITEFGNVVFVEEISLVLPNGKTRTLIPYMQHLSKFGSVHSVPAIQPGVVRDVQIVMKEIPSSIDGVSNLRVMIFPFMSWIWFGGILMAAGGVLSMVSGFKKRPFKRKKLNLYTHKGS